MSHINFTLCFVYMRLRVCASYIQLDQNKCPFTHRAAAPEPSIDAKHRAHTQHTNSRTRLFFRSFFISFLLSETYILFGCNMFSRALSLSLSPRRRRMDNARNIKTKTYSCRCFHKRSVLAPRLKRAQTAHKDSRKDWRHGRGSTNIIKEPFFPRCVSDMWRKLFN